MLTFVDHMLMALNYSGMNFSKYFILDFPNLFVTNATIDFYDF